MRGLLVCNGGFSTSEYAKKLSQIGEKNGDTFEATSVIASDWLDILNDFDVILVSPQTAFRYKAVVKEVQEFGNGQLVYQMRPEDYTVLKAEKVYKEVKKLFGK